MELPEDNTSRVSQPAKPPGTNTAAPADQEARLLADLQTARERAHTAAKLVLDLNGRLETARTHQQQLQQNLADLQTALQAQQAARTEADAARLALNLKLETAGVDQHRLTEQLGARESQLATQTAQRLADQVSFEQQLAAVRAALLASQHAYQGKEQQQAQTEAALHQAMLDGQARDEQQGQMLFEPRQAIQAAEARAEQSAQTEAALRQKVLELEGQAEHLAQIENDLSQKLQAAVASLDERSQTETALRQQLAEAQRQSLAAQDELVALTAAHAARNAEWQGLRGQQQALEQTLATERDLWRTLQDQWAQYKLANQAAQDAAQRQLNASATALRDERDALAAKADENAGLAEQLRQAQQDLAAHNDAHQSQQTEFEASLAELDRSRQRLSEQEAKIAALESRLQQPDAALAARPVDPPTSAETAPTPAVPAQMAGAPSPAAATNAGPTGQATDNGHLQPVATDSCPKLGLRTDRETRHGFASANNRCYARNVALDVTKSQQAHYCLRDSHQRCPVFTGALRSPKEPINTDSDPARRDRRPSLWRNKK